MTEQPEPNRAGRLLGAADLKPRTAPFKSRPDGDSWKAKAKCRGMDPDDADTMFHPLTANGFGKARRYCRGAAEDEQTCPVMAECLAYAMHTESDGRYRNGVWGGSTPADRHRITLKMAAS